ncbi:MAG: O-antigen ligase family protein, partial [Candidatus Omnitrophica bacterium]|nr:O-antigen ligase family protein [Candidatus Omnitrophota bacterium]
MKRKQGFNSGTNKPILFLGYLCALVSLVFVRILENGFDLPKFLVAFGGIICLLCYLLILFSKKNFFPIYKNPLYFPLFLFLGWQVFSIFFAVNKIAGISEIGLTLVCSTLVFIIPLILKDASDVILLARIIAISSGIIAIYGIFQHFGFDFFMWTRENSALSTLGRRNFAGEYLVLVIPWALFCFFTSGRQFKVVFILIFVLLLTHLFLTFTRASWIGFISSILLLLLLLIREPIKTTKVIQFVFMLLLLLLVTNVYAGVFQFEKGTVKSRILIWKSCVFVIKHAPFMGVGTGNFEIGYYKYASDNPNAFVPSEVRIDKAHNEFIEIAVENGIIGLTLFLFFIFTIYKMAWLILASRNKKEFEKFVSIFAIASITGILVNSLASFPLQRTIGSFFFFLNCGILSRMYFNMLEVNPVHKK